MDAAHVALFRKQSHADKTKWVYSIRAVCEPHVEWAE